ncbi:MAG: ATP-binding protein [Nitrospirales bacterium]|jgi:light-regulated signal transduction histidine kinase (bacteriophytochrome)
MKRVLRQQALVGVEESESALANRISELEKSHRCLEEDLLRRQTVEVQLAQSARDLEECNLELSMVRDHALDEIQERKRIESTLRQKSQELARSNQALEQFAFLAAHDLQEPLHSIQVFLDLLRIKYGSALDAQGRSYHDRVKKAASRMQQLIEGLLVYSRVQASDIAKESFSLQQVVEDILADLGASIEELQAEIHVGDLPTLHGDALHIRQLLQNLIANALKFHKPILPPRVYITGVIIQDRRHTGHGKPGRLCQIKIKDEGIGIPHEQIDKIFEMFRRLHRKDEYVGAGIGLAVCQRIVDQCDGAMSVESTLGEGSTFTVTLPIHE